MDKGKKGDENDPKNPIYYFSGGDDGLSSDPEDSDKPVAASPVQSGKRVGTGLVHAPYIPVQPRVMIQTAITLR